MPSNPRLSLLPDGTGATGEDLPFGLRLPADLYNEAIVVVTPGGERMVSRPAGLIYAQGTNQWVVARIKECTGELLPGGGGVIWRDAFEGVAADVVVLCSLLGLQAEVILRGELPLPEAAWGFRTAGVDGLQQGVRALHRHSARCLPSRGRPGSKFAACGHAPVVVRRTSHRDVRRRSVWTRVSPRCLGFLIHQREGALRGARECLKLALELG